VKVKTKGADSETVKATTTDLSLILGRFRYRF
jgi:hypothetical protein